MCKRLIYLICFVLVLGLVPVSAQAIPPPLPWEDADIGTGLEGSADYNPAEPNMIVSGSGGDVWDADDDFHYVYREWSGDCELIARVASITGGTNEWRKCGVMVRDTLSDTSFHAFMALTMGTGHGLAFQYRDEVGDSDSEHGVQPTDPFPPFYVRLTRVGDTFTGYHSPDGQTWTMMDPSGDEGDGENPVTITMSDPVYIGLAVTAHDEGQLATAVFDNFAGDIQFGPYPYASNPDPGSGTSIDGGVYLGSIYAILMFDPGDGAITSLREAFFSDSQTLVEARDASVSLGAPPFPDDYPLRYYVGFPGVGPHPESLERGQTYYWCVDERDGDMNLWQGPTWNFTVRVAETSNPIPGVGQKYVSLTPTLGWTPGATTGEPEPHDFEIYFGNTFADVNDANWPDPEYMGYQDLTDTTWEPNSDGGLPPLDYDTTYYWRIDMAHGRAPIPPFRPSSRNKGDVWNFITKPDMGPPDPNLIGWWKLDEGEGINALDWSGNENDGTLIGDPQWTADGMIAGALDFDGNGDYIETGKTPSALGVGGNNPRTATGWVFIRAFNNGGLWTMGPNVNLEQFCLRTLGGANQFRVQYWGDQTMDFDFTYDALNKWIHFAHVHDGNTSTIYAEGTVAASAARTINTTDGGTFRIARYDDAETLDGIMDDVRLYNYALSQDEVIRVAAPPEAWSPSPGDGSTVDTCEFERLTWKAGSDAVEHHVLFDDDPDVTVDPLIDIVLPVESNSLDPGPLNLDQYYYWQVTEVNGLDVWEGSVWSFRTLRQCGMGTILGEGWLNLIDALDPSGNSLYDLTRDPRFPDNPDVIYGDLYGDLTSFNSGTGLADNYGARMHGWLIPDTTGDYRFWLTTDDPGQLWLSDSEDPTEVWSGIADESTTSEYLIAYIPTDNWADPLTWDTHATQDSNNVVGGLIHLEADQKYYICGMWREGAGGDHCQVAWYCPDSPDVNILPVNGSDEAIIDGYYLMPFSRLWASNPKPRHKQELSADEVTLLSWTAGIEAVTHDVYFGTSLSDVNESATCVSCDQPIDVNFYDPTIALGGPVQWETTYYWRIDEVNGPTIWTGAIWEFTTTNYALVEDFESYQFTGGALDVNGLRYVWKDGWSYSVIDPNGKSGSNIVISGIEDFQNAFRPRLHWEVHGDDKAMAVYYDNDGVTNVPGYSGEYYPPLYSEVEAATTGPYGLGVGLDWTRMELKALSLWFRGHPTREGSFVQSGYPVYTAEIISGGVDIWDVGPAGGPYHDEFHYGHMTLTATTGDGAGEIVAKVMDINNITPEATHVWAKAGVMIRETLKPDSAHAMVVMTPGAGVSFQYRVDTNGVSLESTVPTPNSMPHWVRLGRDDADTFYAYHANDVDGVRGPWFAFPTASVTIPMGQSVYMGLCLTAHNANGPDPNLEIMTRADINNVSLTAYTGSSLSGIWKNQDIGILSNDPEPLYLALEDTSNNVGVKYHDDANAALIWQDWQEWNIDLADSNFDGVDMNNIDMVYIGLGDRDVPVTGGSGVLYLDDIRIYRSRFVPGVYPPLLANLVYDYRIDFLDLQVMAGDWLLSDELILPVEPNDPIALYEFEGNTNDSVLPYYHGDPCGSPTYDTGRIGTQAISLNAVVDTNDYVFVGPVGIDGNSPRTIAGWAKATAQTIAIQAWTNVFGFTGPSAAGEHFDIERRGNEDTYCLHVYGEEWNIMPLDEEWHHLAGTYDGYTAAWYGDGVMVGSTVRDINTVDNIQMGKRADNDANFSGLVDDVHIYDYALSYGEIVYLALENDPEGLHIPLVSIANIYDEEPNGLKWINFKDFAVLADDWLEKEQTWP